MDLFDHWRTQEHESTMQKLQAECARLRRWKRINECVAAVAWLAALGMAIYFYGGKS